MLELHLKRYVAQTEMSVLLVSQEGSRLLHSQILYQYNDPKPIIDEMGAIIKNGAMVTHISMPACMATNHQTRHSYSCVELQFCGCSKSKSLFTNHRSLRPMLLPFTVEPHLNPHKGRYNLTLLVEPKLHIESTRRAQRSFGSFLHSPIATHIPME